MARSGVIYAGTGRWKTTAVKHFAHYIAETTGKATLLFNSDGGGWVACEPEVAVGMIRPYRCEANVLPMVLARKISQGYWPVNPDEINPEKILLRKVDWDEVGGIAVEGWTSLSMMLMRYCADKGIKGGDKEYAGLFQLPITIETEAGSAVIQERFGPSTQNHYGMVQNQLNGLVMNFSSLPVRYVLFTALESTGKDDDGSLIYGPQIAGRKATAMAPAWVGDCIHVQDYAVKRKVQAPDPAGSGMIDTEVIDIKCRYYFMPHPDPTTGIVFPAKPRITPEKIGELRKHYPYGYFEPTPERGFDEYLKLCDRLGEEQAQSDSLRNWRNKQDQKLGRTPIPISQGAK